MLRAVKESLCVGIGGLLGAVGRYHLGGWILHRTENAGFPWSTFVVNVTGCLAIGLISGFAERLHAFPFEARLFLMTGLLGGFTTFSAFGHEGIFLLRNGQVATALAYAVGSVLAGFSAVWLGIKLAPAPA